MDFVVETENNRAAEDAVDKNRKSSSSNSPEHHLSARCAIRLAYYHFVSRDSSFAWRYQFSAFGPKSNTEWSGLRDDLSRSEFESVVISFVHDTGSNLIHDYISTGEGLSYITSIHC
jgi:hypothetical protein